MDNAAVDYAESLVRSKRAAGDLMSLLAGHRLCARAEGRSEKTVSIKETAIRLFAAFLESRGLSTNVNEIGAGELRAFIVNLQERGTYQRHPFRHPEDRKLSPCAVNGYVRAIRAFWGWLLAEELIDDNPMVKVKPPNVPKRLVRPLDGGAFRQLLEAIDTTTPIGFRDYAMILTATDCCLRASELVGLTVGDVDFDRGVLRVLGKGSRERLVPFGAKVAKVLWKYLVKHRGDPETPSCMAFLLTREGRPMTVNRFEKQMARYQKLAGITNERCSPHVLRHSGATSFLELGGDPFTLQDILGHTTSDMTRHYARVSDRKLKAAHRLFSPIDNVQLPHPRRKR